MSFSSDPAIPEQTVSAYEPLLCPPDHIPEVATDSAERQILPHTRENSNAHESGVLLNADEHAAESDVFSAERILRRRTRVLSKVGWLPSPLQYSGTSQSYSRQASVGLFLCPHSLEMSQLKRKNVRHQEKVYAVRSIHVLTVADRY